MTVILTSQTAVSEMVDHDHDHKWPLVIEVEVIKPVAVVKITITNIFHDFHHFSIIFHHLIALITLLPFKSPFFIMKMTENHEKIKISMTFFRQ